MFDNRNLTNRPMKGSRILVGRRESPTNLNPQPNLGRSRSPTVASSEDGASSYGGSRVLSRHQVYSPNPVGAVSGGVAYNNNYVLQNNSNSRGRSVLCGEENNSFCLKNNNNADTTTMMCGGSTKKNSNCRDSRHGSGISMSTVAGITDVITDVSWGGPKGDNNNNSSNNGSDSAMNSSKFHYSSAGGDSSDVCFNNKQGQNDDVYYNSNNNISNIVTNAFPQVANEQILSTPHHPTETTWTSSKQQRENDEAAVIYDDVMYNNEKSSSRKSSPVSDTASRVSSATSIFSSISRTTDAFLRTDKKSSLNVAEMTRIINRVDERTKNLHKLLNGRPVSDDLFIKGRRGKNNDNNSDDVIVSSSNKKALQTLTTNDNNQRRQGQKENDDDGVVVAHNVGVESAVDNNKNSAYGQLKGLLMNGERKVEKHQKKTPKKEKVTDSPVRSEAALEALNEPPSTAETPPTAETKKKTTSPNLFSQSQSLRHDDLSLGKEGKRILRSQTASSLLQISPDDCRSVVSSSPGSVGSRRKTASLFARATSMMFSGKSDGTVVDEESKSTNLENFKKAKMEIIENNRKSNNRHVQVLSGEWVLGGDSASSSRHHREKNPNGLVISSPSSSFHNKASAMSSSSSRKGNNDKLSLVGQKEDKSEEKEDLIKKHQQEKRHHEDEIRSSAPSVSASSQHSKSYAESFHEQLLESFHKVKSPYAKSSSSSPDVIINAENSNNNSNTNNEIEEKKRKQQTAQKQQIEEDNNNKTKEDENQDFFDEKLDEDYMIIDQKHSSTGESRSASSSRNQSRASNMASKKSTTTIRSQASVNFARRESVRNYDVNDELTKSLVVSREVASGYRDMKREQRRNSFLGTESEDLKKLQEAHKSFMIIIIIIMCFFL